MENQAPFQLPNHTEFINQNMSLLHRALAAKYLLMEQAVHQNFKSPFEGMIKNLQGQQLMNQRIVLESTPRMYKPDVGPYEQSFLDDHSHSSNSYAQ